MHWIQHIEGGPKRVNHASVAIRDKIYSFGGYCTEEQLPDAIDVYVFKTVTLEWEQLIYPDAGDYPAGLYGHTVVAYKNKIYLWGGNNRLLEASNKLYCFDLATLNWLSSVETTGHIPKCLDGHSACVIENCMYVFGGFECDSEVLVNMLYKLDLDIFKWEIVWSKGTPPMERDFHTASAIGNRMYIFGGRSYVDNSTDEMYNTEIMYLDTNTCTWVKPTILGDEPRGRRSHSAVVYEGEIYIIGGCSPDYSAELIHLNDIHKFNPVNNQWRELGTHGVPPTARRRHCTAVIGDTLYLFGGSSPIPQQVGLDDEENLEVFPPRLKEESNTHILDLSPTLKRLCQLKVNQYGFPLDYLPINLQKEILHLRKYSSIIRNRYVARC